MILMIIRSSLYGVCTAHLQIGQIGDCHPLGRGDALGILHHYYHVGNSVIIAMDFPFFCGWIFSQVVRKDNSAAIANPLWVVARVSSGGSWLAVTESS